jgi:hypothetical protein
MPKFMIIKRILVEADTLEEAIKNHDKGQTESLHGDLQREASRNDRPRSMPLIPQGAVRAPRPH